MFHSEPFLRCKETGQCFSSFYFFLIYFCPFPRSFPERSIYRNWWQHSPFQFLGSVRCVSHLLPWIPNPKWKLEKPHLQHWATGWKGAGLVCLQLSGYPWEISPLSVQPSGTWARAAPGACSILSIWSVAKWQELWQTADSWLALGNPPGKPGTVLRKKQSNNLKMLNSVERFHVLELFCG